MKTMCELCQSGRKKKTDLKKELKPCFIVQEKTSFYRPYKRSNTSILVDCYNFSHARSFVGKFRS